MRTAHPGEAHLPDAVLVDELAGLAVLGVERVGRGAHEDHALPLGLLDERVGLLQGGGKGFLAQQVPAAAEDPHGGLGVHGDGGEVRHGLDAVVAQHLVERFVNGVDAESLGDALRVLGHDIRDRGYFNFVSERG